MTDARYIGHSLPERSGELFGIVRVGRQDGDASGACAGVTPVTSVRQRRYRVSASAPAHILPGLFLCLTITVAAFSLERLEVWLFGRAWIEALILAIVMGAFVRTARAPSPLWSPGIRFCSKPLLESAVVLLGASVSTATILAIGPTMLAGIAGVVVVTIAASFAIARALGLTRRMAILIACGNAICGNSAIAAVAPVIGADGDDIATSIAFTAVLGVAFVLGLPLFGMAAGLSGLQYGALAGLTVYAVPQVIAAAAPLGPTAVQAGTLIKLVRVLMLGPVCLTLSIFASGLRGTEMARLAEPATKTGRRRRPRFNQFVPWFITGFLSLVAARSLGLLPPILVPPAARIATLLTVVSMAALGLGVDIRVVANAGGRVSAAVILSLLTLSGISLTLIHAIGMC